MLRLTSQQFGGFGCFTMVGLKTLVLIGVGFIKKSLIGKIGLKTFVLIGVGIIQKGLIGMVGLKTFVWTLIFL